MKKIWEYSCGKYHHVSTAVEYEDGIIILHPAGNLSLPLIKNFLTFITSYKIKTGNTVLLSVENNNLHTIDPDARTYIVSDSETKHLIKQAVSYGNNALSRNLLNLFFSVLTGSYLSCCHYKTLEESLEQLKQSTLTTHQSA